MLFKPEVKFDISKQFDRQSMKYQMSKTSCCKDIGIIKLEFEEGNQFFCSNFLLQK